MFEHLRTATEDSLNKAEENALYAHQLAEMTLLAIQNERFRRSNTSLLEEEQAEPEPLCWVDSTMTLPITSTASGETHGYDSEGCYHDPELRIERTDIAQLNKTACIIDL